MYHDLIMNVAVVLMMDGYINILLKNDVIVFILVMPWCPSTWLELPGNLREFDGTGECSHRWSPTCDWYIAVSQNETFSE